MGEKTDPYVLIYLRKDGQVYVRDCKDLSGAIKETKKACTPEDKMPEKDDNLWLDLPDCSIGKRWIIVRGRIVANAGY